MHALSAGTRLPPPPHTHTEHGDESTLFSLGGEGGGGGGEREREIGLPFICWEGRY